MKHAVRNALRRPWHAIRHKIVGREDEERGRELPLPDGLFLDARDPGVLVDLTRASSGYFYTFGPDGWSPFQAAASILLRGGSRDDVRAYLSAFYEGFQPRTLAEACFGPGADLAPMSTLSPFDRFKPWRQSIRKISGHDGSGNQNFGPVTASRLDRETDRVVDTYRSLQKHGYRPEVFTDGYIRGYALTAGQDITFVITSGVHRAAVLSALGAQRIAAKFDRRMPRSIDRSSLPFWPHVRSGFCPEQPAAHFRPSYVAARPGFTPRDSRADTRLISRNHGRFRNTPESGALRPRGGVLVRERRHGQAETPVEHRGRRAARDDTAAGCRTGAGLDGRRRGAGAGSRYRPQLLLR
jgi:hypothetical protein